MRKIVTTNRFKKDLELAKKRKLNLLELEKVVVKLANDEKLPAQYKDHPLKGTWVGFRECHIAPNWLLIYTLDDTELELILLRTGTHNDLF